jgi:hypothetical protein
VNTEKQQEVYVLVNGEGQVLSAKVTRRRNGAFDLKIELPADVRVAAGAGFESDGPGCIAIKGAIEGDGIGQWSADKPT